MIGYLEIDEKIQEFLHSSRKYFTIFITSCHLIRFIGNISTYVKQTKDSVQNTRVEMFSTGISVAPLWKTARHMFVVGNLAARSSSADGQDVLVQKLENK